MTAIATSTDPPKTLGQPVKTSGRRTATSVWACLLLSADERLRRRLARTASTTGWNPVECRTPEEAMRQAALQSFPLALIDVSTCRAAEGTADAAKPATQGPAMQGPATQGPAVRGYDDLVRSLRQSASNLVVICDRDSNPDGELWSRQLGAWMYLPNVDEKSDLARICREAKAIAEKLRGPELASPAR